MIKDPPEKKSGPISLERATFWLIVIGASLLRFYGLGAKSLWRDESESMLLALSAVKKIIYLSLEIPYIPRPPLYFIITHFFVKINDTPALLRLPSALFSILTIILVYYLAKRWFSRGVALLAAFLMALSPFQIYYAQEARSYALLMCLSLAGLVLLEMSLEKGTWCLALWSLNSLAILYTHHFGALTVATQGLIAPILFLTEDRPSGRSQKRYFVVFILAGLAILLFWKPMLTHLLGGLTGPRGMKGFTLTPAFTSSELMTMAGLAGLGNAPGTFLVPLLSLIGFIPLGRPRRRGLIIAALWVAPAVFMTVFIKFFHVYRVRYLIFIIPIYLMMVARGAAVLDSLLSAALEKWSSNSGRRSYPVFSLILAAVTLFWVYPYHRGYYQEDKQNWQAASKFLQEVSGPDDLFLVRGKGTEETNLRYFTLDYYAGYAPRTIICNRFNLYNNLPTGLPQWYLRVTPKDEGIDPPGKYPFIEDPVRVREAGFTVLAPISFGTGTSLSHLEIEFLALSRYKPVTITPLVPGVLSPEETVEESLRLLEIARGIPRGFVDDRPTMEAIQHLRKDF